MIHHHAILLLGTSASLLAHREAQADVQTEYEAHTFEVLAISDARQIIKGAYSKPFSSKTKTLLIDAKSIATEAQHALLKLFEDPPITTKFVLALPSTAGLLPTLLSRLHIPTQSILISAETNPFFTIFQSSSYFARLETIAHITKEKDTKQIEFLCSGVLWYIEQKPTLVDRATLLDCVTKIPVRGASKKMLLEEIALTLPLLSSAR